MSSPDMSFLPTGTSANPFANLSESEISTLAKSLDDVSAGNNFAKIKDVLTQAQAGGADYITAVLQALSADNPKLPPPNPDLDPLQQNLDFQTWLSQNSAELPGKDEAENYAYLMNAITAINTGQTSSQSIVLNNNFEASNLAQQLKENYGLNVSTNASGTAVVSGGTTEAFNSLSEEDQNEIRDFISGLENEGVSGDKTTTKDLSAIRTLIDGFSGTGQVGNLTDEQSLTANLEFAKTLVANAVFNASIAVEGSPDLVVDGPLSPLIINYLANADAQMGDVTNGIKELLAAIPADTNNPDQIKMKDYLSTVLSAIDNLRNLIRELANGNSAKAREASLSKMNDQIFSIKEQIRQQEKAEKAAKKQKTMGLVMKILGPILMLALVIATIASGGLAGPLLALTVGMFIVGIADQIVGQASGQGMFARMFDAISEALPPGVALAIKCIMLVAIIVAAVFCPANGAVAMGLAFSMVSSAGLQKDVTSIAKDHGASDKTCEIINWSMTGVIAAAGVAATAGRGLTQKFSTLADDAGESLSDIAARMKPVDPGPVNPGFANPQAPIGAIPRTYSFTESVMNAFTGGGNRVAGNAADHMAINLQRGAIAVQVGATTASGAMGVVGGVATIQRSAFERQNAEIEALIIELEAQMKALQKIVDTFLNGGSSLNEFADSCSTQINSLFKSMSSTMTALANAANAKG